MKAGRSDSQAGGRPVPSETVPIPDAAHDILSDRPTGYLCTLRPDGRLSVNPVAVMFDGTWLRVSTVKSRRKYRNLMRDARVSICVPHRSNPNRYVEVRGRALISEDSDRSFINSIARAYMGVDEYPLDRPGDERVVITIVAEQVSNPSIPLADDPPTAPDAD
jgi:PPOX class probable F420-dependent enzyme